MKNEIKVKKVMELDEICTALEDLAKSIRAGKVCIENEKEYITLNPAEQISIEFKAAQKKGKDKQEKEKQKLIIEMKWRQIIPETEPISMFKISSEEPAMA